MWGSPVPRLWEPRAPTLAAARVLLDGNDLAREQQADTLQITMETAQEVTMETAQEVWG